MLAPELIERNFSDISAVIEASGRKVQIIPVTKKFGPELYQILTGLNIRAIGENRVQELREKFDYISANKLNFQIHFIGPLQTNKVKYLVGQIASLDSLASLSLVKEINKRWQGDPLPVLLQINSTAEDQKTGLKLEDFAAICDVVDAVQASDQMKLEGLMTMGPTPTDGYGPGHQNYNEATRASFEKTRILRDRLQLEYDIVLPRLSMGMSHDYQIAIEEGATEVRLGSALFGPRPT